MARVRRRSVVGALAVVVVIGLAWAGWLWWQSRLAIATDDAYIDGTVAPVAAKVPGQVVEVNVVDNQQVTRGQVLARIDARDYRAKAEQARAAVLIAERRARAAEERIRLGRANAEGQRTQAQAAVIRAEAALGSAKSLQEADLATVQSRRAALASAVAERDRMRALLDRAQQDLARARELAEKELVARQFVEYAEVDARTAQAGLTGATERVLQAQRDLESAEASLRMRETGFEPQQIGMRTAQARSVEARAQEIQADALGQEVRVREAERDLAEAQLTEAQADLALALLNLEHTEIRAPVDGVINRKAVEVGQVVQIGQPLVAIVALQDVWVVANFKETQLRRLRPGQRAEIVVDTFPDRSWRGVVESISGGTGARFSLLPPENATGNWVKVVQRIPVRIALDGGNTGNAHMLRPGMSAVVTVHLR